MSDKMSRQVRSRTLNAVLTSAFFSWQSAIIIALAIILFGFGASPFGFPAWFWLAFGLIAEVAYLAVSITDPRVQQRAVAEALEAKYTPADIRNLAARERLVKALEYYGAIHSLMQTRSHASRLEFQHTLNDISDWIGYLYELGKRIDQFEDNNLINRDRKQAGQELDYLKKRLKAEPDERVKKEIEEAIRLKQIQLENLQSLEANAKRADIEMDSKLSALGTVYAQLQVIGSKNIDSSRVQRLRNEVHDQVMELQDTIAAIDEVQHYTAY